NGVTADAIINLQSGAGNQSTVGNSAFFIAYNANIEKATGGAGNDTITGNDLSNHLIGNGGDDTFVYGAVAVISDVTDNDTIEGGEGYDVTDLRLAGEFYYD